MDKFVNEEASWKGSRQRVDWLCDAYTKEGLAVRMLRAEDRHRVQSDNLDHALDTIAEQDRIIDDCYGTIGMLTINLESSRREGLDLAKDVDWFVRMQASADAGVKQAVEKAKAFIAKYEDTDK